MNTLRLIYLEKMTLADGDGWALPHINRVLHLATEIGTDLRHDTHAFVIAVYLHDWGAFHRYHQTGIDHALRSRQVAEVEILPFMQLTAVQITIILDAIERHDYRDPRPASSPEALLLSESDFLDFLGVIGFAREFAWGTNDLVASLQRILRRRDLICDRFTLPRAQELAAARLARLAQCLVWLEEESFGYL